MLGFFPLFYSYLWLYLDLQVIYYSAGMLTRIPVFFLDRQFFQEHTTYPGGLGEYAAAFSAQLFYYSWSAAAVVTAHAALICFCTGRMIEALNLRRFYFARFAGPILLLVFSSQYTYHFNATTTLCIALLFICLYLRLTASNGQKKSLSSQRKDWVRTAVLFIGLSVVLYYIAGGAYLVFATFCAIRWMRLKRWGLAALCIMSALLIPYFVGVLVFSICPDKAFTESWPNSWRMDFEGVSGAAVIAPCAVLCILVVVLSLYRLRLGKAKITPGRRTARGNKSGRNSVTVSGRGDRAAFRWAVDSAILIALAGIAAVLSFNGSRRKLFRIHYYACRKMWPQVLGTAGRDANNHFAINAVNRALYNMGRLGDEMFAYPQHPDALLLSGQDKVLKYWHKFDTQLDLGLVNLAQKNLTECMEVYGKHPLILKRLALISMVKGNTNAARIYLNTLSKTLFDKAWARDYLAAIDADPELTGDKRIAGLRSMALKKDHPSVFMPPELAFLTLLQENSKNKMAFEYLMAWYLLGKNAEKVATNFRRINEFDVKAFPKHYQEAICIYAYSTRKPVYLEGRTIDAEVRRQIEEFSRTFNNLGRNKDAAEKHLLRDYGGTYFFYHLYGFSGVKK